MHGERVEIAAAFVEQIAGDGGEARLMPGILRRADRHQHETGDERHLVMFDGADAQAVGQRAPPHFGKVKLSGGPGSGSRVRSTAIRRPPRAAHPASASAVRPFGTTLSTTRVSGRRYSRRRALQGRGAGLAVACEVAIEVIGLAEEHVVGVQLIALAAEPADGLQSIDELRLGLGAAALHLDRRRSALNEPIDFLGDGALELDQRAPRGRGRDDLEKAPGLPRILRRGDLGGETLLEYERAIEARRLAAGEHFGDEIELRVAGREQRRRVPGEVEPRQLDAILQHHARLAGANVRRRAREGRRLLAGLELAEVVLGQAQRLVRLDVASDRQRRVRGPVVGLEERAHVLDARRGDVLGGADRQPVIGMIRRIERRDDRHSREAVGAILVLLPPLVEHDVALVLELRVGERRQQVAHPIRFHPHGELERIRRHDLPVVGAIGVGRTVEQRARRLQRMEEALVVMLRALEHQVLEEMGEARAAGPLVLRADVVPDVHRNDGAVLVRMDQHVQAVVESVANEWNVHVGSAAVGLIVWQSAQRKPLSVPLG